LEFLLQNLSRKDFNQIHVMYVVFRHHADVLNHRTMEIEKEKEKEKEKNYRHVSVNNQI
jgi:hypothetical protein